MVQLSQLRHANLSQPFGLAFVKVDYIGELLGNFV